MNLTLVNASDEKQAAMPIKTRTITDRSCRARAFHARSCSSKADCATRTASTRNSIRDSNSENPSGRELDRSGRKYVSDSIYCIPVVGVTSGFDSEATESRDWHCTRRQPALVGRPHLRSTKRATPKSVAGHVARYLLLVEGSISGT